MDNLNNYFRKSLPFQHIDSARARVYTYDIKWIFNTGVWTRNTSGSSSVTCKAIYRNLLHTAGCGIDRWLASCRVHVSFYEETGGKEPAQPTTASTCNNSTV